MLIPPSRVPRRFQSAALGLAIAGALGLGYANIFVTAPSPENLRTLFEFVFKGLDALGYKEHIDYDLVESTNPQFGARSGRTSRAARRPCPASRREATNPGCARQTLIWRLSLTPNTPPVAGKAIVRVNVFRSHRQTVQYVQPQHAERVSQAELLIIDEAAAIPLPMVKALLGPYLVFLCSTVNGYEGTGRSLSLKLIQQLREQGSRLSSKPAASGEAAAAGGGAGRLFREIILAEPIRRAPGTPPGPRRPASQPPAPRSGPSPQTQERAPNLSTPCLPVPTHPGTPPGTPWSGGSTPSSAWTPRTTWRCSRRASASPTRTSASSSP